MAKRTWPIALIMWVLFSAGLLPAIIIVSLAQTRMLEAELLHQMKKQAASRVSSLALLIRQDLINGYYASLVQKGSEMLQDLDLYELKIEMSDGFTVFDQKKQENIAAHDLLTIRTPVKFTGYSQDGKPVGVVTATFKTNSIHRALATQRNSVLMFGGMLFLIMAAVTGWIGTLVSGPIRRLARAFESGKRIDELDSLELGGMAARVTELNRLFEGTRRLADQNVKYKSQIQKAAHDSALGEIATQVAHDIRSPLTALDLVTASLTGVPEQKRILIRAAVNRIKEMADNLLVRHRKRNSFISEVRILRSANSKHLVASLVSNVVAEMRVQNAGLKIDFDLDPIVYELFGVVNGCEFKRALSNLFNNSIEALGMDGVISIRVADMGKKIKIEVADNGRGINADVLPRLMKKGETFGKANGSGLGLYHARKSVEEWGGEISIRSQLDLGTTVTILLPRASPPKWFLAKLEILPGSTVVILDDDPSVHLVWQERFSRHEVKLMQFFDVASFVGWYESRNRSDTEFLFLFDLDLSAARTGLDIIEELELASLSVLVTNGFEDRSIQRRCENLGVPILPKGLAGLVPIVLSAGADCGFLSRRSRVPSASEE